MNKIYKSSLFLLCLLVSLSVAGCGGATAPVPSVPGATGVFTTTPDVSATESASTIATGTIAVAATATTETTDTGATYPDYGRAPDYTWVAGQLKQEGSCWIVTYVSPLVDIPADQYSNQFALLPGGGWQPAGVKDGEWVVVHGQPEPGTEPASGCTAHGYNVTALQSNPNATGSGSGSTGNGGPDLNIQVTQFTVASNFEIRGQFNATNNGKMNIQDLAPTRIQVKRPSGEVVFEAAAPSIQGSVMDTKPMAGLPPGMSRPYGFSAAPGTISKQVTEGEEVTGILTLSADGQAIEVSLPVTKVTPIRIP